MWTTFMFSGVFWIVFAVLAAAVRGDVIRLLAAGKVVEASDTNDIRKAFAFLACVCFFTFLVVGLLQATLAINAD